MIPEGNVPFDAVWDAADEYHKRIVSFWKERAEKAERAMVALIRNPPPDSSIWCRDKQSLVKEIETLTEALARAEHENQSQKEG